MRQEARYWRAVVRRETAYAGQFVYAVATTGVFCAPGCSSRAALRRHVRFFASPAAAQRAGYRPCLKCRPDRPHAYTAVEAVVHAMCRYIQEHADMPLTLSAIAKASGYSAAHLQRRFTAIVGSSPKAYQMAVRTQHLKRSLRSKARLGDAIYGAGYGSQSRVYERAGATLGMTPKQYRDGGRGLRIHYATSRTKLGWMLLGATERGVCFLEFADDQTALMKAFRAEFPNAALEPMPRAQEKTFSAWMRALNAYLAGTLRTLDLPLDIQGTAFQRLVWDYLQTLPAGEVRSYGQVAQAIGRPSAVRAVASACARNNIAIAIPCHRVIHGNGGLSQYRWGVGRKRRLLDLEMTPGAPTLKMPS